MENLAKDIYEWCVENAAWNDCCIYISGDAYSTWKNWEDEAGERLAENLYKYECRNPLRYFEYANPETLSMSFEGELYRILNVHWESDVRSEKYKEFNNLFKKYNCRYEQGHAWNLSVYLD